MRKPIRGSRLDRTHPLARGLAAGWLLNEGSGPRLTDLCADKHLVFSAAAGESPSWSAGARGHCVSFDGGDYASVVSDHTALDITGSLTIVAWVKPKNIAGYSTICACWGASPTKQYKLMASLNGGVPYFDISSTGLNDIYRMAAANLSTTAWSQVVGVYNANARSLLMYVNGALSLGTLTGTVPAAIYSGGYPFTLGTTSQRPAEFAPLAGYVDCVLIYSRALGAAEILRLYAEPFAMVRVPRIEILLPQIEGGGTQHELAGSVSGAGAVSAAARLDHAVGGSLSAEGTAAGQCERIPALAGSVAGSAAQAASLSDAHALGGQAAVAVQAAGDLTTEIQHELAGSLAIESVVAGLAVSVHAMALSVASASAVSGGLSVTHSAAAGVALTGVLTADLTLERAEVWDLAGAIQGQMALFGRVQFRSGVYVPAQVLQAPYPVPTLWQYLGMAGPSTLPTPFEQGVQEWARAFEQWSEEHMTKIMADMGRLGQEKTAEWVDV